MKIEPSTSTCRDATRASTDRRRSSVASVKASISEMQFKALQLNLGIPSLESTGRFTEVQLACVENYRKNRKPLLVLFDIVAPLGISLIVICIFLLIPLKPITEGFWANSGALFFYIIYGAMFAVKIIVTFLHHYLSRTPYIDTNHIREYFFALCGGIVCAVVSASLAYSCFPYPGVFLVMFVAAFATVAIIYSISMRIWELEWNFNRILSLIIWAICCSVSALGYPLAVYTFARYKISNEVKMAILVIMRQIQKYCLTSSMQLIGRPEPWLAVSTSHMFYVVYVSFSFQSDDTFMLVILLIVINSVANVTCLRAMQTLMRFRKNNPAAMHPGVICMYTEDIMLTEYIECVVPTFYGVMMYFIFYISPQKDFYPWFIGFTKSDLITTGYKLMLYSTVEYMWMFFLASAMKRKLNLDGMRRLGFLLHEKRMTISCCFMTCALVAIMTRLDHIQIDWSFDFKEDAYCLP